MPGPVNAVYNDHRADARCTETNYFHRAGMDETKVGLGEKDDPADVAKADSKR